MVGGPNVNKEETSRTGLKVISLVLAFGLWFAINLVQPGPKSQRVVEAPVTYNPPENLIVIDPQQTVDVRLQGREASVKTLNPSMVGVVLDLSNIATGSQDIRLGPENVFVPEGLEVVSVSPSVLQLEIDNMETRLLPVEAVLEGEPAAGAKPVSWSTRPETVTASGPRSVLQRTAKLFTEPVMLDTHALSFDETVAVRQPDPLIRLQPARVRVHVELELHEPPGEPSSAAATDS